MEHATKRPGIWVLVQVEGGHGAEVGYEMLHFAQVLAVQNRCRLVALVMGYDVEEVAWEAVRYGADSAILVDDSAYQRYDGATFAAAVTQLYHRNQPQLLLIGDTPQGVDLAQRLVAALDEVVLYDCDTLQTLEQRRHLCAATQPETRPPSALCIGLVPPGTFCKATYNAAMMGNIVNGIEQLQQGT